MGIDKEALFKSEVQYTLNSLTSQVYDLTYRLSILESRMKINDENSEPVCSDLRCKNIEECIKNINWERIQDVMYRLRWEWHCSDESYRVPTVDELKNSASEMLHDCFIEMDKEKSEIFAIRSGGLSAVTYKNNSCRLSFELDYYDTRE